MPAQGQKAFRLEDHGSILQPTEVRRHGFRCITTYYFYFLSTPVVKYFRTKMQGFRQSGKSCLRAIWPVLPRLDSCDGNLEAVVSPLRQLRFRFPPGSPTPQPGAGLRSRGNPVWGRRPSGNLVAITRVHAHSGGGLFPGFVGHEN
jgi:hypothetical protein